MSSLPQITVILDHLRSAHNVGNIFQLAEALAVKEVICCGYTPAPPHPKLEKTAMGADKMVPFRIFRTALEAVQAMHADGIPVYAVETVPDAVDAWDFPYPEKVAILLGNEALGISADALAETDGAVSLPMLGEKASINVGNCAAVVLYAICKQRKGS
ncbi:MAG: TrmH family RNA methyltransferase [Lentisphaeria bacterium]|nr:TrmH family RNA methyltransferase [Lentisphaeria bacterium]